MTDETKKIDDILPNKPEEKKADAPPPPEEKKADVVPLPSWKVPEGFKLSDDVKSAIEASIKEGVKPEQVQRFIDLHIDTFKRAELERAVSEKSKMDGWTKATLEDQEVGGPRFDAAREYAKAFVERFGDADLRKFLQETGAGFHPGVFKAFARAGAFIRTRMQEDNVAASGTRTGGGGTRPLTNEERLEKMYNSPDMQKLRTRTR